MVAFQLPDENVGTELVAIGPMSDPGGINATAPESIFALGHGPSDETVSVAPARTTVPGATRTLRCVSTRTGTVGYAKMFARFWCVTHDASALASPSTVPSATFVVIVHVASVRPPVISMCVPLDTDASGPMLTTTSFAGGQLFPETVTSFPTVSEVGETVNVRSASGVVDVGADVGALVVAVVVDRDDVVVDAAVVDVSAVPAVRPPP
jgi:hypothetical protein